MQDGVWLADHRPSIKVVDLVLYGWNMSPMKFIILTFGLVLTGCGNDTASTSATSLKTVDISGSLNGTPVNILSDICEAITISDGGSILVAAGENLAFPKGFIFIFDSIDDVAVGDIVLPNDKVMAGYSFNTTAAGGKITLTSVVKKSDSLSEIAGSAVMEFDGATSSGGTLGSISGSFHCVF